MSYFQSLLEEERYRVSDLEENINLKELEIDELQEHVKDLEAENEELKFVVKMFVSQMDSMKKTNEEMVKEGMEKIKAIEIEHGKESITVNAGLYESKGYEWYNTALKNVNEQIQSVLKVLGKKVGVC